jgi:hypothetical protein
MHVTDWHLDTLTNLGLEHEITLKVHTSGLRYGTNHEERMAYESVIRLRK